MNRIQTICAVPLLWLCGCSDSGTEPEESSSAVGEFVQGVAEGQLTESVEEFAADAEALAHAATSHCEDPSEDSLTVARDRWEEAAKSWYELQLFNFGPADADPVFPLYTFIDSLRLRGEDYQETVRTSVETWLAGEEALDAGFFSGQRFQFVGLLAAEVVLFDNDDLVDVEGEDAPLCQILMGLTGELSNRANELSDGWLVDGGDEGTPYIELFVNAELPSGREPFPQLIISTKEYVEYLHNRRVVGIAGDTSGTGWALVGAGVGAVQRLLTEDHGVGSIVELMRELEGDGTADEVEDALTAAKDAVDAQDEEALNVVLLEIEGLLKAEIPTAFGVDLGLTFADGD